LIVNDSEKFMSGPAGFALAATVLLGAPGCLSHRGMQACTPIGSESECWVSSKQVHDLRHVIVERVTPVDDCNRVEIEHSAFDHVGQLVGRVLELRRCGVIDRRAEYRYDFERGIVSTRVDLDLDHDDQFDVVHRSRHPMMLEERSLSRAVDHRELTALPNHTNN
jgi:hypothetical protein